MKLFYSPGACSLSPHIVLREAKLPFELEQVDLGSKTLASGGDYRSINPKGYVPALMLDNGEVLTEGPAIVQYVADLAPDTGLVPAAGTLQRYRVQEWLNFITSELHKNFGALFNPRAPEEWKGVVRELLDRRLGYVAQQLGHGPYLRGERFTVCDAYLFTMLSWCKPLKVDLSQWPVLLDYMKRVAGRPAVQEALRAEGLVKG